jgi:hypothetical protein
MELWFDPAFYSHINWRGKRTVATMVVCIEVWTQLVGALSRPQLEAVVERKPYAARSTIVTLIKDPMECPVLSTAALLPPLPQLPLASQLASFDVQLNATKETNAPHTDKRPKAATTNEEKTIGSLSSRW